MKALLILLCLMSASANALTPREREWVQGIQAAAAEDRTLRAAALERNESLLSTLGAVREIVRAQTAEIAAKEAQSHQVAKERDDWKAYGADQHEKWMKAETRVQRAQKRVWQMVCATGMLSLGCCVLIYLLLKP